MSVCKLTRTVPSAWCRLHIALAQVTPENPMSVHELGFDSVWVHSGYFDIIQQTRALGRGHHGGMSNPVYHCCSSTHHHVLRLRVTVNQAATGQRAGICPGCAPLWRCTMASHRRRSASSISLARMTRYATPALFGHNLQLGAHANHYAAHGFLALPDRKSIHCRLSAGKGERTMRTTR